MSGKVAPQVFNRLTKLKQRQRYSWNKDVEYLRNEVARRTIERLSCINRDYKRLMDFGGHASNLLTQLDKNKSESSKIVESKLETVWILDSCAELLNREKFESLDKLEIHKVVEDEETYKHPQSNFFDAVVSNLSLHWNNDLPSVFKSLNASLKPDGMFMGSVFTTDTLFELRTSLQIAEMERKGGVAPHVSPFIRSEDLSNLLKNAGFELITIDVEEIVVCYPDLLSLMRDLQQMGEANSIHGVENIRLSREVLISADAIYKTLHGEVDNKKIILPLTFRILNFIGWKKLLGQPQPLPRGSGEINLKDVL